MMKRITVWLALLAALYVFSVPRSVYACPA